MITLGIDLSSSKEGTAACHIEWQRDRAVVAAPEMQCDDEELLKLIKQADVVGIDAPFGWPEAFVDAVARWKADSWSPEIRRGLRFRATDLYVQEKLKIWPLSVSTDRIALPAMRANALLTRHSVTDRSGSTANPKAPTSRSTPQVTPRFVEVYPAASLKSWGLPHRGYKLIDPDCRRIRLKILRGLRKRMPWLEVDDEYVKTSDALDALVASLTARAAGQGLTEEPPRGKLAVARREGWIHVSDHLPGL